MKENERFYKVYDCVLSDARLSYPEKILYGVIVRLAMNGEKRCFASNKALAEIMGCSKSSVVRWLDELEQLGYIKRRLHYRQGMKNVDKRYIMPVTAHIENKASGGQSAGMGYTHNRTKGGQTAGTGYTQNWVEGIPTADEDSKINTVKEFSKSEGSKNAAPKSSNFFLNLAVSGNGDDIF